MNHSLLDIRSVSGKALPGMGEPTRSYSIADWVGNVIDRPTSIVAESLDGRNALISKVVALRSKGVSYPKIGKALGIAPSSAYRLAKEVGLGKLPPKADPPGLPPDAWVVPKGSLPQGPSSWRAGRKRMVESGTDPNVEIALLKRDQADTQKELAGLGKSVAEILERVRESSKKPLVVEHHDKAVHVACPNCGIGTDVAPIAEKQATLTSDFDEVLGMLERPHKEGANAFVCPKCYPKIESKFEAHGLKIIPLKPAEPENED